MSRTTRAAAAAALALALAGCALSPEARPADSAPESASFATLDNCGTIVSLSGPPERVLALKSTSIEMMLALGQQDRLIGIAYQDGPIAEAWADRGADLVTIDDQVPSSETALELEPDFIYAGWESMLTEDSLGDRDSLARIGVNSYVSPAACQSDGYRPASLSFDDVFNEVREVGAIFDAEDEAEELVTDIQHRLADIEADDRGLTALWYSSGVDIPFVGAGGGSPQMIMNAVGLQNVASGVEESWVSMGWEAILDADPDLIVLVGSSWNSAEKKIALLEEHASSLRAVQEERYLVIPFATTEAGVRSIEAVELLHSQLASLDLAHPGASAS